MTERQNEVLSWAEKLSALDSMLIDSPAHKIVVNIARDRVRERLQNASESLGAGGMIELCKRLAEEKRSA